MNFKTLLLFFGLVILVFAGIILLQNNNKPKLTISQITSNASPTIGKVKYPEDYTFVLVGDSMTAALGNSDELKSYLLKYYPDKTFEFLNYGFGSTNILSVKKRLLENTTVDRVYQPILNIDFDIILIESFGHNPLSEFPLEEGLKKQTAALDEIVDLIKNKNPRAAIVFVATLAPNSKKYGLGQVELTPEKRAQWAAERSAYIENHIAYAKAHNIPIVNIYENSLLNGDGNLKYFDNKNYIHPSPTGIYFISQQIADFLYQAKILETIKKEQVF